MKQQREDYEKSLVTIDHLSNQLDAAMLVSTAVALNIMVQTGPDLLI